MMMLNHQIMMKKNNNLIINRNFFSVFFCIYVDIKKLNLNGKRLILIILRDSFHVRQRM